MAWVKFDFCQYLSNERNKEKNYWDFCLESFIRLQQDIDTSFVPVYANYKEFLWTKAKLKLKLYFDLNRFKQIWVHFNCIHSQFSIRITFFFFLCKDKRKKNRDNFFSSSSWNTETGKAFIFHLENVHMCCVYEQWICIFVNYMCMSELNLNVVRNNNTFTMNVYY